MSDAMSALNGAGAGGIMDKEAGWVSDAMGVATQHRDWRRGARRPLLYAVLVLLALIVVLTVAGPRLGVRPIALIGFPVMLISVTALILVLLTLSGPNEEWSDEVPVSVCLELTCCPAVAVDPKTERILHTNSAAAELFGPGRAVAGGHFQELFEAGAPPACTGVLQEAVRHGSAHVPLCAVRTGEGEFRGVQLLAKLFTGQQHETVVVAFIPNHVGEALASFASVQERLMSNISHELRTPLSVVMGFSELLSTGTLGELSEKQRDAVQEIYTGGQRILNLVNDILDIGRIRSYHLPDEQREVAPAEIVCRMENLLTGQARRNDIRLEVRLTENMPKIKTYERFFKQAVYHLILNSIERSSPGDMVTVEVTVDDALRIIVTDAGPEPLEIPSGPPKLTEAATAPIENELAPPLAVGLPLCVELTARLGGSLQVSSDEQGSHFTLELPLHEPPAEQS